MNKLVKVFAFATMLIVGGQAMAQTRGAMFLGVSFPVSDFAEFEGFDEFALKTMDVDDDDAGAGIGFNAGLKWYFNPGVRGLGVMLSVDGFFNGPCTDLKNAYRELENSYDGQIIDDGFKYKSKPQYINVPAMLGLNYIYHVNPNLGVYVEAGAGGNLRYITHWESVKRFSVLGVDRQITTDNKYDNAFSFAYQVGVGVEVAKNLVVGCSFYDLGGAPVNGDQTIKTQALNDNVTGTSNSYLKLGTIRPTMVLVRIGFSF